MVALAALLSATAPASAVPPFEVPWTDRAPRVEPEVGAVRVAALGAPDERLGRFSAAKRSARHAAEERARDALHRWADEALARARACPWMADRVHAVINEAMVVVGIRPLVDGSAVVLVDVPVTVLRDAATLDGVPWAG